MAERPKSAVNSSYSFSHTFYALRNIALGLKLNLIFFLELILKPRGNESPQMTRMRAHWWMYRQPKDAVILLGSRISQSKTIEATLLNGMAQEHEHDHVNALSYLQKNTKLLYVHAYQAWIWNNAVSQRIHKYGLRVLIGDLVKTESNR